MDFENFEAQISLRDKVNREKYIGSDENWEKAERAIIEACEDVYKRQLKKKLPDMPVEYVDERFTSVLAHRTMLEAGLKKKDRQNKAPVSYTHLFIIIP